MGHGFLSRFDWAASPNRRRATWLATTGLTAILLSPAAVRAQSALPPNTTPQGGTVVGGSSSISQSTGSETITQTSQRTAIDWQTFNVGSAAKVQFVQPSSSAIALNRVVTPEPSIIAGRIDANGQLVLINQSGVVFTKGSQVNAESIVVSTSNIANKDFMAGHLNFTGAPNPGAKIVNNGQLTAGQAGLVGLVAPQVANNGVITAQLGQVVLAGASAFTLDLYGDRLISLDVTQAVRAVDVGGKLVPALVTNQGLILADGGKITLTAQDADALVTQLVDAGGTIRANSLGGNTGTVSLQGVGGNINIAGNLLAQGTASGTKGGAIEAVTTGTVAVASGAVIDASGVAGGGVVALGTNIARAEAGNTDTAAPRSGFVAVAPQAVIKADATGNGNGGKVTLLSARHTDFAGTISAQGGPHGGAGGLIEISSDDVISLEGAANASAEDGPQGSVMLDPATLVIGDTGYVGPTGNTTFGDDSTVGTSIMPTYEFQQLQGTIVLEASKLIDVESPIDLTFATGITLASEQDILINAAISLGGSLQLDADGSIGINAALNAGGLLILDSGTGLVSIDAPVTGSDYVQLQSGGGIQENSSGLISTPLLESTSANAGNDDLVGDNAITQLGSFTVGGGSLTIFDTGNGMVTISGPVLAGSMLFAADTLDLAGDISATHLLTLEAPSGPITQTAGTITAGTLTSGGTTIGGDVYLGTADVIGTLGNFSVGEDDFTLDAAGSLNVAGSLSAEFAELYADTLSLSGPVSASIGLALEAGAGGITELPGGSFTTDELGSAGTTIGGTVALGGANSFDILEQFAATGNIVLNDTGGFEIEDTISTPGALSLGAGGDITEPEGGLQREAFGSILAGTLTSIGTIGGAVSLGDYNVVGTLGNFAASGNILLSNDGPLDIAGLVSAPAGLSLLDDGVFGDNGPLPDTGNITEIAGGTITASELDSGGSTVNGNVELGNANSITALDGFTVGDDDDLTVKDGSPLDIAGEIIANSATFSGSTLSLSGPILVTTDLALEAGAGGVTELAGDRFTAQTLSSGGTTIGGAVNLGSDNNFADLGGFAAKGNILLNANGNFALVDGGTLTIDGAVNTPATLSLEDPGALAELAGGTITAGMFTGIGTFGSVGDTGNVVLGNPNTIGAIGGLTASGDILINNSSDIDLTGLLVTPGQLTLLGGGGITETAGGTVSAAILTSGTSTLGGGVTLGNPNTIGTLAAFGADGGILLNDSTLLLIDGLVYTPGLLTLQDSGSVTEDTGGTIFAGTLSTGAGLINGDADLRNQNSIGTLGAFTLANGALYLNDTGTLSVAGPADVPTATITAGSIAVPGSFLASGALLLTSDTGISIPGDIDAGGLVLQVSDGNLSETGGSITAGDLSTEDASISGDAVLDGTNSIAQIGFFTVGGNFILNNAGALDIAAPVQAGSVTLADNGAVSLSSGLTATGGQVTLAVDGLAADGGAISALDGTIAISPYTPGLAVDVGGSSVGGLELSNDVIGELDPTAVVSISGGGSILAEGVLNFANPLLVFTAGAGFTQTGVLTGNAIDVSGGSLAFDGDLTAASLNLAASGNITEPGGAMLDVGTLGGIGVTGGSIALGGTANAISTLAAFTATGPFTLDDAAPLTVTGPVSGSDIALTDSSGGMAIDGELSAGTAGTIALTADAITAGDSVQLLAPGGTVVFTPFTAGTNVYLGGTGSGLDLSATLLGAVGSSTQLLEVITAGSITGGGNVVVNASTLLLNGNGIGFTGTLGFLDSGVLALTSGDGVTTAAGETLTAGTLLAAGPLVGPVDMTAGTNVIGALGTIIVTGTDNDFALNDAIALDIVNPVTARNIGLGATGLTIASAISATGQVSLTSSDGIAEANGGAIFAPNLTGAASSGSVQLDGGNVIGTLAGFSAAGNLSLQDGSSLFVTGDVSAQNILLAAAGIDFDAAVSTGVLALASSAGISQSGGAISAAELTSDGGTIAGAADFGVAQNAIQTLGIFAATGNLTLVDSGPLAVAGPVDAANIDLTADGIGLNGALNTGTLQVASGAGIAEGALGSVAATELTTGAGNVAGDTVLNNTGNTIATLGSFTAPGGLTLNDAQALGITGPVSLGGGLALLDAHGITQTGGTITAAALTSDGGTIGGDALFGSSGNDIASLGDFSATGNLLIVDAGGLNLTGNINAGAGLTLNVAGAISQSAGTVATPVFDSDPTSITMPDANRIGLLGNVVASGDVYIAGVGEIGQLSAADATITSPGNLSLSGDADISGNFDATDGSNFTQTGTLSAANASISSGSDIALDGPDQIGGGFTALAAGGLTQTGQLSATDAFLQAGGGMMLAGADQIAGNFTATADQALIQSGNLNAANASLNAGSTLALQGPDQITGDFIASSGLGLTQTGALTATDASFASGGAMTLGGTDQIADGFGATAGGDLTQTGALGRGQCDAWRQWRYRAGRAGPDRRQFRGRRQGRADGKRSAQRHRCILVVRHHAGAWR